MSADVDHDVTKEDYWGNDREYYVTGYYKLQLTVHTPDGRSFDLPGVYDHVTDAEDWIDDDNYEFSQEQRREEEERMQREEDEEEERRLEEEERREREIELQAEIDEEEQIARERFERHSLL